jgi:beta-phosphoglucomutase-like phosphatase (HAD superfamily)
MIDSGNNSSETRTAFVFDLDGTVVDSVYQHVLAWREALESGLIDAYLVLGGFFLLCGPLRISARSAVKQPLPQEAQRYAEGRREDTFGCGSAMPLPKAKDSRKNYHSISAVRMIFHPRPLFR